MLNIMLMQGIKLPTPYLGSVTRSPFNSALTPADKDAGVFSVKSNPVQPTAELA